MRKKFYQQIGYCREYVSSHRVLLIFLRTLCLFAIVLSPSCSFMTPAKTTMAANKITVEGTAENARLGACVKSGSELVWIDGLEEWPDNIAGKKVSVTGTRIERHDLPVFIQRPGEPIRAGIPVPEGTDLEQASLRVLLTGATWNIRP